MMNTIPKSENKERVVIWLKPSEIQRMDSWLQADNCRNRTEFVSKALSFYMGYLTTEDVSEYLSNGLLATVRGVTTENNNRLSHLLFKLCVELNMAMHTVAAHFDVDDLDRQELRQFAEDEVKRANGQVSFDKALRIQRQRFDED